MLSLNIFFIRDMPELLKNEYTDKKIIYIDFDAPVFSVLYDRICQMMLTK